ncbi:MAG TPA: ATP-binding cassette domain-containing protein [Planctomycetota bacterium]|jgi:phospholipid/cholesterol/gamma-HCH transport system ATP-binding protein|nr:ATP-binding cassette domain-containing protein [Planctomycetota bacterium]
MTDHGGARDPSFSVHPSPAVDAPEVAIRIEGLYKSFGPRPVLRGFSLDVQRGEMLAIVGGSGSGKSVLLKHLAGLIQPDRGSISIDGIDLVRASPEKIREVHRKIGYLFQEGGLLNSLSIYDNLALPLRETGDLSEDEIRERVTDRLRRVGVAESEEKMPSELSGGMRKRAGLARAITEERSFFFFDEPTSALDPLSAASIRSLIRELHEQWHSTSLVVTHDLALVASAADRIAFLYEGQVRQTGSFEQLSRSEDEVVRKFFEAGGCVDL